MVNIEERKINIEEGAKKKFDIIGNFIGCKPKIINYLFNFKIYIEIFVSICVFII